MGLRLVVVLLMACGGAMPCAENAVYCSQRCLSVCEGGEWRRVRCLSCDESMPPQASGVCRIESSRCMAPSPRQVRE